MNPGSADRAGQVRAGKAGPQTKLKISRSIAPRLTQITGRTTLGILVADASALGLSIEL